MGKVLSAYTTSRNNNFNLMRFVAAALVLYSHSFPLSKGPLATDPLGGIIYMTAGGIAVDVFFITSGFLITYSYFSRNNIIAFIWARILRIYPALFVAILFCVFVVGVLFTTYALSDYLFDPHTLKFFRKNVTLFSGVRYDLPGVFAANPFKNAVNGSLWTLPYEIKMYTYLAIIAAALVFIQKRFSILTVSAVFLIIAIAALCLNIANHFLVFSDDPFLHLFSMFFVGVAYYIFRDSIYLSSRFFLAGVIVLFFSVLHKDLFFIAYCILLPYLVFSFAYIPDGRIRGYNKAGDYSYGLYIYAFPVQQSVAAIIPDVSVTAMTLIAMPVTLLLAVLSWHMIEKKALKLKGRYVVFERMLSRRKSD